MHQQHHPGSNPLTGLIPLFLIALLFVIYLIGVYRLRRVNKDWSNWRTISFGFGVVLLAVAVSPGLMRFAHQDMRGHMAQHLLIGMLAPIGLVLGAPVTLILRAVSAKKAKAMAAILGSTPFHYLSHPVTALLLNIGGMYLLYLTPLYNATFTYPSLHHLIHLHFLLAGYLFTWAIAGPDPAPRRPGFRTRLIVLFLSMATHAFLSKFMYAYVYPLDAPHSAEQIRSAAQWMYYGGDFSELILATMLFTIWYLRQKHPRISSNWSLTRKSEI